MSAVATATDLEGFRAEARAWLEANAPRRSEGSAEYKQRMAARRSDPAEDRAALDVTRAVQRRIFDAGFAGLSVPEAYGGRGLSMAHERVWAQEAAGYLLDTGALAIGIGMALPTILAHGTEEQKQRFIEAGLRADHVWCQLFSEPGAGSDLAGLTTTAVRDGDEWVVDGQKVWNSGAHVADWGILLARTDWDVPKHRGLSYFLVDMSTTGVEPRPLRQITGVARFNETFLTGVRIPDENLLGGLNNGWAVAQTTLMNERQFIGGITAGGIGFGDWLALTRHFGREHDVGIRAGLAELYTRTRLLEWLGQRARAAMRTGKGPGAETSVAKLFVSKHIEANAQLAMAIEGTEAMLYADDAFEDGFWQQQFLGQWNPRIGGGTEQIQRNVIAERVLGMPGEPRPDKNAPFRDIPRNA